MNVCSYVCDEFYEEFWGTFLDYLCIQNNMKNLGEKQRQNYFTVKDLKILLIYFTIDEQHVHSNENKDYVTL